MIGSVATLKEIAACVKRQHKNASLHNTGGTQETDLFILNSEHVGGLLQTRELAGAIPSPLTLHKHKANCGVRAAKTLVT